MAADAAELASAASLCKSLRVARASAAAWAACASAVSWAARLIVAAASRVACVASAVSYLFVWASVCGPPRGDTRRVARARSRRRGRAPIQGVVRVLLVGQQGAVPLVLAPRKASAWRLTSRSAASRSVMAESRCATASSTAALAASCSAASPRRNASTSAPSVSSALLRSLRSASNAPVALPNAKFCSSSVARWRASSLRWSDPRARARARRPRGRARHQPYRGPGGRRAGSNRSSCAGRRLRRPRPSRRRAARARRGRPSARRPLARRVAPARRARPRPLLGLRRGALLGRARGLELAQHAATWLRARCRCAGARGAAGPRRRRRAAAVHDVLSSAARSSASPSSPPSPPSAWRGPPEPLPGLHASCGAARRACGWRASPACRSTPVNGCLDARALRGPRRAAQRALAFATGTSKFPLRSRPPPSRPHLSPPIRELQR